MYMPPTMLKALARDEQKSRIAHLTSDKSVELSYYEAPRLSLDWVGRVLNSAAAGVNEVRETVAVMPLPGMDEPKSTRGHRTTQEMRAITLQQRTQG